MMCYVTYAIPHLVQPLVMMSFVLQNGQSPLYTTSRNGHLEVMKTLIVAGANINQADKVGTRRCIFSAIVHATIIQHSLLYIKYSSTFQTSYFLFLKC